MLACIDRKKDDKTLTKQKRILNRIQSKMEGKHEYVNERKS